MFRFTIRDVLWLIMIAGLALAWFADHAKQGANFDRAANMYLCLKEGTNGFVEALPDGTYRFWNGPKSRSDGTLEFPNRETTMP